VDYIYSKPYFLTFSHHRDYLEARVVGFEDSFEISCSYWREIAAEVRRGEFDKVLVVEKLAGNVGITEAYLIACHNAGTDFRQAKIAFVDEFADHGDVNQFTAVVSNNRGRNIRCHDSVEEARRWLTAS
jgi:hypothetical protein